MAIYTVAPVTTLSNLDALHAAWSRLFYDAGVRNPVMHPIWLTAWARHFVKPGQLYILTVYRGNTLVGVAPFYRRCRTLAPGLSVTTVQLLGAVEHSGLIELSQTLVQSGMERPVLSAIMRHFGECMDEWDWIEIILPPEQGWFEPQWLTRRGSSSSFVLHKATRACVVMPLPSTWEELRAGMKRNIKESLRHGINSLEREKHTWEVAVVSDHASLTAALRQMVALHRGRASIKGKMRHADSLSQTEDRAFLRDVAPCLFESGQLSLYVMRVDGEAAAAQLVLHANGTTFLSISGFDPRWWSYNVATTLTAECLRGAIARQDNMVNFSPGPHVAKLRWSDHLELHQEFVVVGGNRRSQLIFSLYWQLRAAAALRRERHRHEKT